ncbi:Uncharacterized protein SCG7086_AJ_00040 [Chlamydiales bacterium SCGC AG-110-P3]|nr:Uncharacterized protein SCG7086_AJ_00040 [Chlamydiales bacterium SCGC AG-110-P3]
MNREERNKQVANYWSWVADRGELGYWNLPGWDKHQNLLASGNPHRGWLDVLGQKVIESVGNDGLVLSLGCGSGSLEPLLLSKGLCSRVEGCDISADLVAMAQQQADKNQLPIKYFQCDLNVPNFEKSKYNIVVAAGILHHVENLEGLFANVKEALKPGGVFLVYDYIGPTRFQWTSEQTAACNELLKEMPLRYRWKRGYPWYYVVARGAFNLMPWLRLGVVKKMAQRFLSNRQYCQFLRAKESRLLMNTVLPPPPEQFIVTDPSEAVRSEEILPLLRKCFQEEAMLPLGGTLIAPLFNRTVRNFIDNAKGKLLANNVLKRERELIKNEALPSDFVAVLMRK